MDNIQSVLQDITHKVDVLGQQHAISNQGDCMGDILVIVDHIKDSLPLIEQHLTNTVKDCNVRMDFKPEFGALHHTLK